MYTRANASANTSANASADAGNRLECCLQHGFVRMHMQGAADTEANTSKDCVPQVQHCQGL
jgi:hypothetical protein